MYKRWPALSDFVLGCLIILPSSVSWCIVCHAHPRDYWGGFCTVKGAFKARPFLWLTLYDFWFLWGFPWYSLKLMRSTHDQLFFRLESFVDPDRHCCRHKETFFYIVSFVTTNAVRRTEWDLFFVQRAPLRKLVGTIDQFRQCQHNVISCNDGSHKSARRGDGDCRLMGDLP